MRAGWKAPINGVTPVWPQLLASMRGVLREEGQMLVEFAMASLVLIPILFGSIEACLGFYSYNFVADAAREATRYAMVRGSTSCQNTPGLVNCGFNDGTTNGPIQSYVQGLGYPGARNLTATVTWLPANSSVPCPTACNQPGNQVQVTVKYNFLFGVPFIPSTALTLSSTSSMVISQ